ncbi:MAG: hypothetical protein AAB442_02690 [Patescibacteria group bacterium]
MNQRRLWVAATIIAVIIVGGFVISVPHTTRDIIPPSDEKQAALIIPVVSLRDSYQKGQHTLSGSLEVPTVCTTIVAAAYLRGASTSPESIEVALTVSSDTGVCLQLPTTVSFSTTLAAPAELPITVTVNGVTASTTRS